MTILFLLSPSKHRKVCVSTWNTGWSHIQNRVWHLCFYTLTQNKNHRQMCSATEGRLPDTQERKKSEVQRKLAQKNLASPSFRPHPHKYTYRTSSSSLLEGFGSRQTPWGLSSPAPTLMPRNTSLSKNRQIQGRHQLDKLSDDCAVRIYFFFFYSDLLVTDISE